MTTKVPAGVIHAPPGEEAATPVSGLRADFGLTREDMAQLSGFSLRAVAGWAGGEVPSAAAQRRLREVRRLLDGLATVFQAKGVVRWLRTPNPAFGGQVPLEVVGRGEGDRLWAMIYELGSGEPL